VPVPPLPVVPLPVLPVVPVPPELPLVPDEPVLWPPVPPLPVVVVPPPTGAAPPEAEDTGIVGVVVEGGVVVVVLVGVVVVVVVDAAVPVATAGGGVGPVPTTVRTAVGAVPVCCGDGVLATMALPWAEEMLPLDAGPAPPDWLTVPMGVVLAGPPGRPALGTVVGVLLECEETGPLAESTL
jgi:hypothetical protein